MISPSIDMSSTSRWSTLADAVLSEEPISRDQALAILESTDDELLDLVSADIAYVTSTLEKTVQLYFLDECQEWLVPEDCNYCSQSKISDAPIPKYNILSRDKLLDGARLAAERQSKTYCIVISGRAPNEREMKAVETIVPEIKKAYGLNICACLGLLSEEQRCDLRLLVWTKSIIT